MISSAPTIFAPSRCRCSNTGCSCGPSRNWRASAPPRFSTGFCTRCQSRDDRPRATPVVVAAARGPPLAHRSPGLSPALSIPAAGDPGALRGDRHYRCGPRYQAGCNASRPAVPPYLRLTKNVAAVLPITIDDRSRSSDGSRWPLVMPEGIESPKIDRAYCRPTRRLRVEWPSPGPSAAITRWPELHIEMPSPLGLWVVRESRPVDCYFPRVSQPARPRHCRALSSKSGYPGLRLRPPDR